MAPVRTMTSYRKSSFIKKIVDSFFGQMASSMLTIFITFLIANLYGAKVMGEYYYVITIILMASIFVRLGMDNSLLYFIPRNGNMYNKMSFVVITLVTIPVIFIIYIFTDNQLLQTALPLILIVSVQELFFAILRAQEKIKQYFFIKLLFGHVIQIIFIGLSYYLSLFDSIDLLIIFYISNLVSLTAFLIYTRKSFSGFFISKKFIKYSIPTIFISFVGVLINRVDILMIGNMMPIHNVGLYQVATQIAFLISFSLVIFNIAFAPEISKLHSAGKINDIKQIYLRSTRLIFSLCLIIFLIVFFYSQEILRFFGDEFIAAEESMLIRSAGQLIVTVVGSVGYMLTMSGQVNMQFYRILVAVIVNIICNYFLIPIYGINGAAIGSFIALSVSSIIGYALVKKKFNIKLFRIF